MLIPLGILAASGAGVASDYELIESVILTSSQSSVTFSNLGNYSSTYQHLQIRAVARLTSNFDERTIVMRLNSDTGNNYAHHALFGQNSAVSSIAGTSQSKMDLVSTPAAQAAANIFGPFVIDILDPYETKNTTIRTLSGNPSTNQVRLSSGVWLNTASLTTITILENFSSSNFAIGSRFSLYGVKG